eukprot:m.8196 g.8196  ORF g.8196 m.8196 type:complete len:85 (+) comp9099_c0_seq3:399-653(+)
MRRPFYRNCASQGSVWLLYSHGLRSEGTPQSGRLCPLDDSINVHLQSTTLTLQRLRMLVQAGRDFVQIDVTAVNTRNPTVLKTP